MGQSIFAMIRQVIQAVWEWTKRHAGTLGSAAVILFLFVMGPTILFNISTAGSRFNAMDNDWASRVPEMEYAIVPGAGVYPDGTPTPYLKWRVETAVELYKARRVDMIIMSGDNSSAHYNEPEVMARYAESLGMPEHDIVLDYAGFSTYDTCYRAKFIFGVTQATIVSQGYHVPRAVMTCRKMGVQSIGVAAKHTGRDFTVPYLLREILSTDKAVVQIILKPQPTVAGNPQHITH